MNDRGEAEARLQRLDEQLRQLSETNAALAISLAAALEALLGAPPDAFDLVITDRAMPDMNGEQRAQAVKADTPATTLPKPLSVMTSCRASAAKRGSGG